MSVLFYYYLYTVIVAFMLILFKVFILFIFFVVKNNTCLGKPNDILKMYFFIFFHFIDIFSAFQAAYWRTPCEGRGKSQKSHEGVVPHPRWRQYHSHKYTKLCIRCQPSTCPPCFSSCLLGQSQWPGQPMQPSNYADHRRSHGRFPISVWRVQLAWQEGNTQSARSTGNGGHNIWRAKPAYRSVKLLENLLEKCLVHCTFFLHEQIIRHFDLTEHECMDIYSSVTKCNGFRYEFSLTLLAEIWPSQITSNGLPATIRVCSELILKCINLLSHMCYQTHISFLLL